jgi:hypothetical protein
MRESNTGWGHSRQNATIDTKRKIWNFSPPSAGRKISNRASAELSQSIWASAIRRRQAAPERALSRQRRVAPRASPSLEFYSRDFFAFLTGERFIVKFLRHFPSLAPMWALPFRASINSIEAREKVRECQAIKLFMDMLLDGQLSPTTQNA